MDRILTTYLTSRLETSNKSLDLDWLGFFSQSSGHSALLLRCQAGNYTRTRALFTTPVIFNQTVFGQLHAASHSIEAFDGFKIREQVESIACQFAVLLAATDLEKAMALDREMERLQKENRHYDWCGIYKLNGKALFLNAFRGPATPHVVIPRDEGICGAAVRENQTLNIPDVTVDSRYISCDVRTRSELVVPIRNAQGEAVAEIDIDSHLPNAFSTPDIEKLEKLATRLAPLC